MDERGKKKKVIWNLSPGLYFLIRLGRKHDCSAKTGEPKCRELPDRLGLQSNNYKHSKKQLKTITKCLENKRIIDNLLVCS